MRTLIVGAGRVGRSLAEELTRAGHEVRVLDPRQDALAALTPSPQLEGVLGSPLAERTLTEAAAGCDALAAVTADDAVNAVVALAARRRLRIPLAVAVVEDPRRAESLAGLGAHVVCPTARTAAEVHLTLVRSGIESELLLAGQVAICRADVPARLSGRTITEIERPGELIVIAVERDGHVLMAVPRLSLAEGDVLHAATQERDRLSELVAP